VTGDCHAGICERLEVCSLFGISRQSYYEYLRKEKRDRIETNFIIEKVMEHRAQHPKIGGRKLYHMLKPVLKMEKIKIGRDQFFDILSSHNLLIKRKIRRVRTTYSNHWLRKYSNLIKRKIVNFPNEVWVSDITYWNIENRFLYITLITDCYS